MRSSSTGNFCSSTWRMAFSTLLRAPPAMGPSRQMRAIRLRRKRRRGQIMGAALKQITGGSYAGPGL